MDQVYMVLGKQRQCRRTVVASLLILLLFGLSLLGVAHHHDGRAVHDCGTCHLVSQYVCVLAALLLLLGIRSQHFQPASPSAARRRHISWHTTFVRPPPQ